MKGSLPLRSGFGGEYRVFGGPYMQRPEGTINLKMAAEIHALCDIDVPTEDFQTPDEEVALAGLEQAIDDILRGFPVYVGCMGGIGRTGLMLALIAKAWGIEDPVSYVREHYYAHAVETKDQQHYIREFDIPPRLRWKVRLAKFRNFMSFEKKLTRKADTLLAKIKAPAKRR